MWIDTKQLTCPNEYLIKRKFWGGHFSHLSFHFSGSATVLPSISLVLYYSMEVRSTETVKLGRTIGIRLFLHVLLTLAGQHVV